METDIRKLKIYSKCRPRNIDPTNVPEIRLEGKWVEKLGFEQAEHVIVRGEPGKLTITLISESGQNLTL